jgi:hypothetical protein
MKTLELAPPAMMSPRARAAEITSILATAIIRTQRAHVEKERAVDLGFLPKGSVHTTPYPQESL